jgi:hypothetical protein
LQRRKSTNLQGVWWAMWLHLFRYNWARYRELMFSVIACWWWWSPLSPQQHVWINCTSRSLIRSICPVDFPMQHCSMVVVESSGDVPQGVTLSPCAGDCGSWCS